MRTPGKILNWLGILIGVGIIAAGVVPLIIWRTPNLIKMHANTADALPA